MMEESTNDEMSQVQGGESVSEPRTFDAIVICD